LLIDKIKLSDPGRIKSEIGLSLPPGVRIASTSMHRFSLVDGRNYEWLIQSDRDITDWVEANMRLEGGPKLKSGGWGDITAFGQVSSLAQGEAAQLQLDGVWKSVRQVENGKLETAYLFLAKGGKVGELSTFRP
jgi:nitroimidazol reductase NimA-like FMN-containing flavoprotein (pyridoxamine 5'-phosphate oxidase superfamily)